MPPDERHPRALEVDEELRELARECEYTDGAGFPDDDPEYGDTIDGLVDYKDALESRVYDLEVKLADATKPPDTRPGPPEGHKRVDVSVVCQADLHEEWQADVPEHLTGVALREHVEALFGPTDESSPLHFVSDAPDNEHGRQVYAIDGERFDS